MDDSAHPRHADRRACVLRQLIVAAGVVLAGSATGCSHAGGGLQGAPVESGTAPAPASPSRAVPPSTKPASTASSPAPEEVPAPNSQVSVPAEAPERIAAHTLEGRIVVLDPGHNGGNASASAQINRFVDAGTLRKPCNTTGTATNAGYAEAGYTWDVARRAAALLRARGARVVLTRKDNHSVGPCIDRRAAIANAADADAVVSIHADGGPSAGRGFHVIRPALVPGLTDDIEGPSRRLALTIRREYRTGTDLPYATYIGRQGLDVRDDLGGLNLSEVPVVFLEGGNMRNAQDAALLSTTAFRARAARSIVAGLSRFLAQL